MACELLVAACMGDLVPWPGMEPGPPALGARSLNHCATREVPRAVILCSVLQLDLSDCFLMMRFRLNILGNLAGDVSFGASDQKVQVSILR